MTPLLTIGIPTYNRAELLRLGLKNLFAARRGFEAEVEVVVSDNASEDGTQAVLEEFRTEPNSRFSRNTRNTGPLHNILHIPRELARGEYCWVIGDDDYLLPHTFRDVTTMLRDRRELDFFLLNHFVLSIEERNQLIASDAPDYQPEHSRWICAVAESGRQERIARALELGSGDFRFFTHIAGQIIRTAVWRTARLSREDFGSRHVFDQLESTYPHLVLLLAMAKERPVWYCGSPVVGTGLGSQEWASTVWLDCVFVSYELIAAYKQVGVSRQLQERMLEFWLKYWLEFLPQLCGRSKYYTPPPTLLRRFLLRSLRHPWKFLPLLASQLAHDGRRFLGTRAGRILGGWKVTPDGTTPRPGA